ncbi:MAG: DUF2614 family zinc ribbon-containing protein [Maioricimonas sp. JB049]
MGVFGLVLIAGILGLIVLVIFVASRGLRLPGMGHVTLVCPHCGKQTRAGRPICTHCNQDL